MAATAKMMHWIDPVTTYKSEKIAFFTFAPLTLLYLYGSSSVMPLAANIKSTSIMHTIWHEFTPRWLLLSHCQTCEVIIRLHVSPLLSYFFVAFQHCIVIKCNSWLSNFFHFQVNLPRNQLEGNQYTVITWDIGLRLGVFKPFFPSKTPATRKRKKGEKGFPIFCCLSTLTLSVDCYAKNTKTLWNVLDQSQRQI